MLFLFVIFNISLPFASAQTTQTDTMKTTVILSLQPLDFLWPVKDPFLFCAHHLDYFPKGNEDMEPPRASLLGRNIGQDFTIKDGWRMYHGETIPGFPEHPHRGFETVTIVMTGLIDHADSWGQAGRYGNGDVQWMTAGAGLQHSEMFPLLKQEEDNTNELFQVWLNLSKDKKFAKPHYKMLWSEDIPVLRLPDADGKIATINLIAGTLAGQHAPSPAPDSWAADPEKEVCILTVKLQAGAKMSLPPASAQAGRNLYFYRGNSIRINGEEVISGNAIELKPDAMLEIEGGSEEAFFLLLQGRPIQEPVAQYGPFVMNTQEEIHEAISDYRKTEFGGWPWPRRDMVFPKEKGRFAKYLDGTEVIK